MSNYVVSYQHTKRTLNGVFTRKSHSQVVTSSIKKAADDVNARAIKNGLEDFKIMGTKKVLCFECMDTGISRYDGCACC